MFVFTLCHIDYKDIPCFTEEKGFILILELFTDLGSGVWLFQSRHIIEIEAR